MKLKGIRVLVGMAVVGTVLFGVSGSALAKGPRHLLDGKSFSGPMTIKGEDKEMKNTLSFQGGRLHSSACEKVGFRSGSYTAKEKGKSVSFNSEYANGRGDRMVWKGKVKEGKLTASAKLYKKGSDKASQKFSFKGSPSSQKTVKIAKANPDKKKAHQKGKKGKKGKKKKRS